MDAVAPPTPTPSATTTAPTTQMEAPYAYAATEGPGQAARERDLCKNASQFDWIYSGSTVLLTAGAIALDNLVIQSAKEPELRLTGPALIGITWGSVLGGGYLSLPKCDAGFVDGAPPDGDVHVRWPIAVAVALLAGATAPLVVGIETGTGPSTDPWSTTERSMRLVVASAAGIGGSLLPYVLPPRTWRAAQELRRIRAGADGRAAFLSYTLSF